MPSQDGLILYSSYEGLADRIWPANLKDPCDIPTPYYPNTKTEGLLPTPEALLERHGGGGSLT